SCCHSEIKLLLTVNRGVVDSFRSSRGVHANFQSRSPAGNTRFAGAEDARFDGPTHGFGIALRIQQVSKDLLQLNQGTLYPALLRLEQRDWISSKWGVSEN